MSKTIKAWEPQSVCGVTIELALIDDEFYNVGLVVFLDGGKENNKGTYDKTFCVITGICEEDKDYAIAMSIQAVHILFPGMLNNIAFVISTEGKIEEEIDLDNWINDHKVEDKPKAIVEPKPTIH